LQEAEQLSTEIGSFFWINVNHFYRAQILLGRGQHEQAKAEAQRCIEYSLQVGEKNTQAKSLLLLSVIAELENDLQGALKYLPRGVELLREIGSSDYIWWNIALGRLHYQKGDREIAKQSVRDSLELVKSKDMGRTEIAYVFYHLGGLFVENQTRLTVQFLALAGALRQRLHYKRDPTFDKPYSERFLSAAWAKLGEDEFTRAWEVGLKLRLEEALDLALKTVEEL
jgi:tetratricopeptide (TPR) repeat protein